MRLIDADALQALFSTEILDFIEWFSGENGTEYEKGILTGLRIAEHIAEAVERNSEVSYG